jgi:hypothetical protein
MPFRPYILPFFHRQLSLPMYLFIFIPISTAYGVHISQLIRYARACSACNQFLIPCSLLTIKLMSQRFLQKVFLMTILLEISSQFPIIFISNSINKMIFFYSLFVDSLIYFNYLKNALYVG